MSGGSGGGHAQHSSVLNLRNVGVVSRGDDDTAAACVDGGGGAPGAGTKKIQHIPKPKRKPPRMKSIAPAARAGSVLPGS